MSYFCPILFAALLSTSIFANDRKEPINQRNQDYQFYNSKESSYGNIINPPPNKSVKDIPSKSNSDQKK